MKVLTKIKTTKHGDYTYNLMSNNMIHINNHKTNSKSIIVLVQPMINLVGSK